MGSPTETEPRNGIWDMERTFLTKPIGRYLERDGVYYPRKSLEGVVLVLYREYLLFVSRIREICTYGSNGRACRVTGIPTHLSSKGKYNGCEMVSVV